VGLNADMDSTSLRTESTPNYALMGLMMRVVMGLTSSLRLGLMRWLSQFVMGQLTSWVRRRVSAVTGLIRWADGFWAF